VIARAAVETAPLLFTAFGNRTERVRHASRCRADLHIFQYAISPVATIGTRSLAGALVLIALIDLTSLAVRQATGPLLS